MSVQKPKSVFWYLLPVCFQIIGGVIAFLILRKSDPKKAKTCLIIGGVLLAITLIVNAFATMPDTPLGEYITIRGSASVMGELSVYVGIPAVIGYYILDKIKNMKHSIQQKLKNTNFIYDNNNEIIKNSGIPDYVIYHYHHYENTHLSKMMDKYDIDEVTRRQVLDNMIDVYKVATDSTVFPTYGNGLKQIAPYLGFKWRHKDVSATESISIYLDYVRDPEENKEMFQKVIDYNEDDCIATMMIKDWLSSVKN